MKKKYNAKNEMLFNRAKSVPIIDILNHYGIDIKNNNKINCLWHDDSSPSAHIYEESNAGYCFGCSKGSFDGIAIVMKKENIDFFNAILFLNNNNFIFNDNFVIQKKKNLDMYFNMNDEIRKMIINDKNVDIKIIKKYGQLMDYFYDNPKVILRLYRKMLDILYRKNKDNDCVSTGHEII
jgi:hypothetical protein